MYVDLKDDAYGTKCSTYDKSPRVFEYYADGGVSYAQNFIESEERQSLVDYRWGTDQIYGKLGIEPSVRRFRICSISRSLIPIRSPNESR